MAKNRHLRRNKTVKAVPQKKKRKKKSTEWMSQIALQLMGASIKVLFYAVVISCLLLGVRFAYRFGYDIFVRQDSSETGQAYEVRLTEDTDIWELAKSLKQTGLIEDEYVFYVQYYFFEYKLEPGVHTIYSDMSSRGILEQLSEGVVEEDGT